MARAGRYHRSCQQPVVETLRRPPLVSSVYLRPQFSLGLYLSLQCDGKGLDLEIEAESNRWQARPFYNSKRLVY